MYPQLWLATAAALALLSCLGAPRMRTVAVILIAAACACVVQAWPGVEAAMQAADVTFVAGGHRVR